MHEKTNVSSLLDDLKDKDRSQTVLCILHSFLHVLTNKANYILQNITVQSVDKVFIYMKDCNSISSRQLKQ